MPATIRDIKEQTGLSLATISKYLNGGNVLPENKIKIEAAIRELHYEVNEMARGLITKKTRMVGVLVYSVESLFNGTLLKYIGDSLRKRGYGLLICDSSNDEAVEAENLRFLVNKRVDGIIVVPISRKSDFLKPARDSGIPVVMLDRQLQDVEYDCVKIDNRMAASRAVGRLIEKNHKKIAIICSDKAIYTGYERYLGYRDAMEGAGFPVLQEYEKQGSHSIEHGYESMRELIALDERPTAVFMTNYEITLGAVMAVNESELNCPEDISMLGFDDLILSHVVSPKMCMIAQPMREMGEKSVELLLNRIASGGDELPVEIVMSTRLVVGNSIRMLE